MQTFRAYVLDAQGRITRGHWVEAANEREALEKAKELCRPDSPNVEVWLGAKKIGEEECSDPKPLIQ